MRVLGATIGALLISVSHVAFAQEHLGEQQGEAVRAECQCDPDPASQPQRRTAPEELRQSEFEQVQAERPPAEAAEMQPRETAEQIRAQPPEYPLAETAEMRPTETAEQILAKLPERPLAEAEEQPTVTAEQILAQLPERPLAEAEVQPTVTAEQILAQLPERPSAERSEMRQPGTAAQLLARLPERPLAEAEAETDEPRQPEAMKAEMQQDQPPETAMPRDPKWTTLKEANLGTTMELPGAMFSRADGHAHKGVGRRYKTPDGRAKVAVWTQRAAKHDTPERYVRRTFRIPHATVDYERFAPDFAAISGVYGHKVYYLRCNYSPRSDTFHCFDLAYPAREKKAWESVVTRMSRSLRPLYH